MKGEGEERRRAYMEKGRGEGRRIREGGEDMRETIIKDSRVKGTICVTKYFNTHFQH